MQQPEPVRAESHWPTILRELVITTLGVLVALAINSWWGERQDRAHERTYLAELLSDLDRSIAPSNLPLALAREDSALVATTALIRAFRMQVAPPSDSIAVWLFQAQTFASYTPLTATARALLGSRDISLIRSDSVRTYIVAMVSTLDENAVRTHDFELRWREQAAALEQYTDFVALKARVLHLNSSDTSLVDALPEWPVGKRREPFPPTDYAALLRNREVYRALVKMRTAHDNTRGILQKELDGLQSLRPVFARSAARP